MKNITTNIILILTFLSILISAQNNSRVNKLPEGLDPNIPPEMAQFSFLVGEFDCSWKSKIDSEGNYATGSGGKWIGKYTLNGYAFEDDWISGSLIGTTWRTYDRVNKRWICKWLQSGTDNPIGFTRDYFYARYEDNKILIDAEGKDTRGEYKDRIMFYDISDDGFKWKIERSYDGGETWIENMRIVEARRVE